jgi:hypothetical protein
MVDAYYPKDIKYTINMMGQQPIAAGMPHRFWVDGIPGCGHESVQNWPARSPDLIHTNSYML